MCLFFLLYILSLILTKSVKHLRFIHRLFLILSSQFNRSLLLPWSECPRLNSLCAKKNDLVKSFAHRAFLRAYFPPRPSQALRAQDPVIWPPYPVTRCSSVLGFPQHTHLTYGHELPSWTDDLSPDFTVASYFHKWYYALVLHLFSHCDLCVPASDSRLDLVCLGFLSSQSPKSKVPKSRPKGLGLTLKSHGHGPPTPLLEGE